MDHTNTGGGHGTINTILFGLAGVFSIIQQSSADQIYTWTFRGLSLVSILLIIIINWNKYRKH